MTNPDNVGGLLPCPGCGKSDLDHCPADFVAVNGLTRGMIVRCAWCHFAAPEAAWNRRELCRAAPAGGDGPPEFTDTARAALLWVLWHHQGASSKVGQPIRFALGMAQHERMNDYQLREAKRWGEIHYAAPSVSMSDELFAALELSVKQADKIIRSDKGCGACGDGCSDRGSCRLTDESPSAERCQKCHGTLEVLTNCAEPWSASAYSPCPDCHPAAKKDSAPAGSGEVDALLNKWLVRYNELINMDRTHEAEQVLRCINDGKRALLRKLQQGAE